MGNGRGDAPQLFVIKLKLRLQKKKKITADKLHTQFKFLAHVSVSSVCFCRSILVPGST